VPTACRRERGRRSTAGSRPSARRTRIPLEGGDSGRRQALVVMPPVPHWAAAFSHMAEAGQFWPDPAPPRLPGLGSVRGLREFTSRSTSVSSTSSSAPIRTATAPRVCRCRRSELFIGGQVRFRDGIGHHPPASAAAPGLRQAFDRRRREARSSRGVSSTGHQGPRGVRKQPRRALFSRPWPMAAAAC